MEIDYIGFKEFFLRLFGIKKSKDDVDEYIVSLSNRYKRTEEQNLITIKDSEIKELFDRCSSILINDDLTIIKDNTLEIILDTKYPRYRYDGFVLSDETNSITYTLSQPSLEYSMLLLMKLYEKIYSDQRKKSLPIRLFHQYDMVSRLIDSDEITWQNMLPLMIGELSLHIEADPNKFDLEQLKCSFLFNYM